MESIGPYRLRRKLGEGAVGVVWEADDTRGRGRVALKVVTPPPQPERRAEWRERVFREVRAASRLSHPGLVRVHDVIEHEGQLLVAMELAPGRSLRLWLAKRPFSEAEALEVVEKAARAIHHAHESGVLHRDLKPENVLLDRTRKVTVIDFGLAKELDHETRLTESGALVGTPRYVSPEQASGSLDLDAKVDIWALGGLLYELLAGRPAFSGETFVAVLTKILSEQPAPPVPGRAGELALWALSKDPAKRPASALELADALAAARAAIRGRTS